jgi:hypothetical protein
MKENTGTEDALVIRSLGGLQLALLEDNNDAIRTYIERLDRETSNDALKAAGAHFDFPTVEVEGVFRTSGNHISRVFGYKRPEYLQKLLDRHGIFGINVGGFRHDGGIKIHETLGLSPHDQRTALYDWPAFLIAGMNSTNEEAKAVQAYLLRAEMISRVGIVAVRDSVIAHRDYPDAAIGSVMSKLAHQAWKGNPIAAHILEQEYAIPATELLAQADPEINDDTESLARYLMAIGTREVETPGLLVTKMPDLGYRIAGSTAKFFVAFLDIAHLRKEKPFFRSRIHLGQIMGREAMALELLGWRRRATKVKGIYRYVYEYTPPLVEDDTVGA